MTPADDAIPTEPPGARLLDLTRLVSRVGRGSFTGIDRVEAVYLERFLAEPLPLFSLVQTRFFNALLDRGGTQALADRLMGRVRWGRPSLAGRLRRKIPAARRAAESDVRRLAVATGRDARLGEMLVRHLPKGTALIAVGHGRALREAAFRAAKRVEAGRVHVLLHDTIPLDFPDFVTPRTLETFARQIPLVARNADLVICNSEATRTSATRHFAMSGRVPPMVVAHLGTDLPVEPDPDGIPPGLVLSRPYFVALGTLEARKNHDLLLDVWEHFARGLPEAEIPLLVIVGRRGWSNGALFARLDASPLVGVHICELPGLADRAVATLLREARALLMPSHVEGFGLPPGEALRLGTEVIANDLPVYREVYGNNLIYLPVGSMYPWAERILDLARAEKTKPTAAGRDIRLPTWQDHFDLVLKVT